MTPMAILSHPASILTQSQREFYFDQGYIFVERMISSDWLERMRAAAAEIVERSRSLTLSNRHFVLEPDHSVQSPRVRRVYPEIDLYPVFWEFASQSPLPDLISDVVGPDVKYRETQINFKWAQGGSEIGWHQDIPFYPHTNLNSPITLTYLDDVGSDQAPLMVVPRSHKGTIFEHYDESGQWVGRISDKDLKHLPMEKALSLPGRAGTVIVLHSCVVHGSKRNDSHLNRPLVTTGYSSADSFSYTPMPWGNKYMGQIVRGQSAKYAHHDAIRLRVPPDWSAGYTSIYEHQTSEQRFSSKSH